ncbi:hypothetical protein [Methanothermococcus sp.]|nr:hypothetical protein [Methanothermococcus sp.]
MDSLTHENLKGFRRVGIFLALLYILYSAEVSGTTIKTKDKVGYDNKIL